MKKSQIIIALCLSLVCLSIAAFAQNGKRLTIRGQLARTVEAGGWVINTPDAGKYLFLNAGEYSSRAGFREGAVVEARGETKPDVMTIYQEGTPFQVAELTMISRGANLGETQGNQNAPRGKTQITVTGDALINALPDTAIVTLGVVTQNKLALAAQADNARKTEAVVRALRTAIGANAEIKTSNYSLQPQRGYKENQPPTIVGYEARNSVTITLADLNRVGAVIDTASNAGANNVDGLAFMLRRDQPAKAQALRDATAEAMSKVEALATALGGRVTRIVAVEEDGVRRPPVPVYADQVMRRAGFAEAAPPTPIEVGSLEIASRVQLTAEIER